MICSLSMRESSASLERYRDAELTLEALAGAAARLLRHLNVRPDDGRIAAGVDARGIRYYQALGVLDRPVRYDGRRAVYGYRHLLQLLAVKKLQQEGHPLQLIQRALAGRTTEGLEEAIGTLMAPSSRPARREWSRGEGRNLREDDANAAPGREEETSTAPATEDATAEPAVPRARSRLVAAQVARGVTLTLDPSVVADPEAVIALVERTLSSTDDPQ
jgi:DNA-binding transcriptional MerR regulator